MNSSSKTQTDNSFVVRVTDCTKNMVFLVDRHGDLFNENRSFTEQLRALSMTPADIEALVETHDKCFSHNEAFLVYDKIAKDLRIMVEYEIDAEDLPKTHPRNMNVDDFHLWRATLSSFATALHYIEENLRQLDEDVTGIETIFDFGGYNNGSICVMLPLDRAERYTDAYLLLFDNPTPFLPSKHAQLAAMGALRWKIDEGIGIPADILPRH